MDKKMKKVAVVFTGGTISMRIDDEIKAAIPAISDEEIMAKINGIEKVARTEHFHFGNLPGPHITPTVMFELYQFIQSLIEQEEYDGIVLTHGTDTLEETAYLLDLLIDSKKPVAITGSMRNGSELGYDGPANLAAAICTVVSDASVGRGVLVVMNNEVYSADEVQKMHTLSLDTFKSPDFGPLGIVDQDEVIYYRMPKQRCIIPTTELEQKVVLVKTVAGMDSDYIYYCLKNGVKGIVIEAMGRGNVPPRMVSGIAKAIELKIPVVIVSRCPSGRVLDSYGYAGGGKGLRDLGVILGDNLSGPKARLKLMAILGMKVDNQEVKEYFEKDLYKKI